MLNIAQRNLLGSSGITIADLEYSFIHGDNLPGGGVIQDHTVVDFNGDGYYVVRLVLAFPEAILRGHVVYAYIFMKDDYIGLSYNGDTTYPWHLVVE